MLVPLSWLRTFVDWSDTPEALAQALTGRGLAVEAVRGPVRPPRGIVAARILAAHPHPERRNLSVCTVRAGEASGQVLSGAPNTRAGMLVPWAQPGSVLPDGREIGVLDLAGMPSEGMLCAADELGLPGGHEGLLVLDGEQLPDGTAIVEGHDLVFALALGDAVLEIELTPNYAAHCQSILGVAREVAALTGGQVRLPAAAPVETAPAAASRAQVHLVDDVLCPRYVARVLALPGDERPAPLWMAQRLVQCGIRPLGAVVDVTNYVLCELGQPLHAFDLDQVAGGGVTIRRARSGEAIQTLDGRTRALEETDLVIADRDGAVAVAGVMGGERTAVGAGTRHILLESAYFNPEAVGRTSRRLGLATEAAARFVRGVDPATTRAAADRAAVLLAQVAAARTFGGRLEAGPGLPEHGIHLRGQKVRALLGLPLSTSACGKHLEAFGFTYRADGADRLRVTVPSWRPDVRTEVDLVEEIARGYGYDALPAHVPGGAPGKPSPDPVAGLAARVRQVALAAGCSEVVPYSYHGEDAWDLLRLPADHPWRQAVRILNPMSGDQSVLRTSLAVGLLRSLAVNARHQRGSASLCELGRTFRRRDGARPLEQQFLGVAGYGHLISPGWAKSGRSWDFFSLKGLWEAVFERGGLGAVATRYAARPEAYPWLHPGRSAEVVRLDTGETLGWLGELHPEIRIALDLPAIAVLGELNLSLLAPLARVTPRFAPLPRHPAAHRDLAVVAPDEMPAAELQQIISRHGQPLLAAIELFDVYAGAGIAPGHRSLAFALTYRADRTLRDSEVDACHQAIRNALATTPGVDLR